MLFVALVIFIVVMIIWGLAISGAIPGVNANKLAFVAVLVLGIVVFLFGTGVIPIDRPVR